LEDRGHEIIKLLGKGAFGEVVLTRESIFIDIQKTLINILQSKA